MKLIKKILLEDLEVNADTMLSSPVGSRVLEVCVRYYHKDLVLKYLLKNELKNEKSQKKGKQEASSSSDNASSAPTQSLQSILDSKKFATFVVQKIIDSLNNEALLGKFLQALDFERLLLGERFEDGVEGKPANASQQMI